jgi:hypothetical protein
VQQGGRGRGGERANFAPKRNFFEGSPEDLGQEGRDYGPIAGEDFSKWSDRLRDVEEMVDDPGLRNQIAQVRERARALRAELKRHGKDPQWPLVKAQVSAPLAEIRDRVAEELARREKPDAIVPIDRDPVPGKFSELVRRYYEKLGTGTDAK